MSRTFDLTGDAFEPEPEPQTAPTAESPVASDEARLARELQRALEMPAVGRAAPREYCDGGLLPHPPHPVLPPRPSRLSDVIDPRNPGHAVTMENVTMEMPRPSEPSRPSVRIEGVATRLAIAEVLADPKDNVSRGGRPWLPNDREVIDQANGIEREGLISPPEVRKLTVPIPRDTPALLLTEKTAFELSLTITNYKYKVSSGFKRFAALQLLASRGGPQYATFMVVSESDVDARRSKIRNLIENLQRIDPTEYNLALIFAELAAEGQTSEQIAKSTGARMARVDQLVLIATKLPPALLDMFAQQPTPEMRRVLASIAVIDAGSVEASHAAMLEEWHRLQQGELTADELKRQRERGGTGKSYGTSTGLGPAWYRNRLAQTRAMLREAGGWSDPQRGTVRELTMEQREFADELLRWLTDPKGLRNPLR